MYNLIEDPHEDRNVAAQNPGIVAALRKRMEAFIARREQETGTPNPMLTQGDWHGIKGVGPFKSSQQAYDSMHIGDAGAAQRLQAKNKYADRGEHKPGDESIDTTQLITIIGRGHSGTRAMSHTLSQSGVYMGNTLNGSGDLLPPQAMYDACRVMAKHIVYKGNMQWDFSKLHTMPIPDEFKTLINTYLESVLKSPAVRKGWKIPETTLVFPWIARMFPDAFYIHWIRDPRDCILGNHLTDDLATFGVPYDKTDDLRLRRAISWKYQNEIVKATPKPKHWTCVRLEDFVLDQAKTLKKVGDYLGFPLVSIPVKPEVIGRYRTDKDRHDFDLFQEDLIEHGYKNKNAKENGHAAKSVRHVRQSRVRAGV